MKSKMTKLFSLLAVFLCLTALSTTAYARTDDDAGEEVITGVVYADSTGEDEEKSTEAQSLTPEGNMSLVDDIDSENADNMQFITVASRNGNYFYIIIDRSGDGENTVHFLNQVDEADLLALMDEDAAGTTDNSGIEATCICTTKCAAGSVNTYCAVCKLDMTQCCGEEPEQEADPDAEVEPDADEQSGGNGTLIIVLILALAGGGAAYYFKIYKPKSKGNTDLDDYDFGDDDEDDTPEADADEDESEAEDETDSEYSDG